MPYVSERSHTLLSIEDKPENTGGQNFSSSKPSVLALKQSPFIFFNKKSVLFIHKYYKGVAFISYI
jgi:hypothetical protein